MNGVPGIVPDASRAAPLARNRNAEKYAGGAHGALLRKVSEGSGQVFGRNEMPPYRLRTT